MKLKRLIDLNLSILDFKPILKLYFSKAQEYVYKRTCDQNRLASRMAAISLV